jgi:CBS domain-containing protein
MNTIAQRIADFLKDFPPFEFLDKTELINIASFAEVIHLEAEDFVFRINQPIPEYFYVVKNGAVGLYSAEGQLVDQCDEGDLFGLKALLRQGTYMLEAKAVEETVLYTVSSEVWETHILRNPKAAAFLMSSMASNSRGKLNAGITFNPDVEQTIQELQTADYSKDPITCHSDTSIQEAAQIMTRQKVGSIVIVDKNRPLGIITDKDLRTKVATGLVGISEEVSKIMSSPVLTFPENITVAQAQLAMLRHKITHLCITEDGTVNSNLKGILSEHDIIVLREMTAASLVKEIKRSKGAEELRVIRKKAESLLQNNIEQGAPIDYIGKLLSAINDTITQKVIDININQLGQAPCSFAWLAIGSQGRQEQLLMTDQDNALIFENTSESNYAEVKKYFLKLAEEVNESLAVVGFEPCPSLMMASNPQWCQSVSKWANTFEGWITHPDEKKLMLCTIFFDFESVYGSQKLIQQLSESIFNSIEKNTIFLNYLGRNALQNPPPLSFFRQFLVEESGKHKDQFDIKARAMMPLVDAARLLILAHNIKSVNNTIERYLRLAKLEPQNEDVYLFCAESFKDLLRFRTQQGLKHQDSGRFIELKTLNKGDKLKLKRSFKAIKQIQGLIQTRYKLSQLM